MVIYPFFQIEQVFAALAQILMDDANVLFVNENI
jgi:hypothetical protein